ncbi:MAG: ABC transporter permease [Chlamydiota bacterium]
MRKLSLQRIQAIIRKEFWHILRDPFTLALAIGLPLFFVAIFGTAINFDVSNISIAVEDNDNTTSSRQIVEVFENTGFFIIDYLKNIPDPEKILKDGEHKAVLIIEPDFENELVKDKRSRVQILIDGSDNTTASTIVQYVAGIEKAANIKIHHYYTSPTIDIKSRFLYNPELQSKNFIVPGLSAAVLAIISILLTALTIAGEWEKGSMELLLSTPIRPLELIIGKITPYTLIGLLGIFLIYILSRTVFSLPFLGSHLVFLAASLLFLTAYLAQGILISTIVRQQQLAMQFAIVTGLLPSLLLSGFVFPISNMPLFFQHFTSLLPAKWYIIISRGLFLRGTSLIDLATPFWALIALNIILVSLSLKNFKKDLEP